MAAAGTLPAPRTAAVPAETVVDFDVHGHVTVRLVDPSPADLLGVRRVLGPPAAGAGSDPDLVVCFVERPAPRGPAYVELHRSGSAGDDFYLLGGGRRPAWARVPLDRVGGPCEIACERGSGQVPLLLPLVKLAALWKGLVPLHASAFAHGGAGVLVSGWAHGGKTSALLAFARAGAAFVGDDVVFVRDGRIGGLRAPLTLSAAQAKECGAASGPVRPTLRRVAEAAERGAQRRGGAGASVLRACGRAIQRLLRVEASPEALFREIRAEGAALDRMFLMVSRPRPEVRVEEADPGEVAERIAVAAREDLVALTRHYLAYRFAFPGRRNRLVEEAPERLERLARQALAGVPAYLVHHPHPAPLAALHAAMRPYCGGMSER